jgi:hypothetical protein
MYVLNTTMQSMQLKSTKINYCAMAKIKKPVINRKGAPPPEIGASTNLSREPDQELKPLNFKVKTYATQMDMSMVDLLQTCFEFYKSTR